MKKSIALASLFFGMVYAGKEVNREPENPVNRLGVRRAPDAQRLAETAVAAAVNAVINIVPDQEAFAHPGAHAVQNAPIAPPAPRAIRRFPVPTHIKIRVTTELFPQN